MPLPSATIPNPEFYADPVVREAVADYYTMFAGIGVERIPQLWSALPEDYGYAIPKEGAWIVVKEVPHTELTGVFDVPLYSMWRARPCYRHTTLRLRLPRKTVVKWPLLRAVITTPEGELQLLPGEFTPLRNGLRQWVDLIGHGVDLHFMGDGEPGDLADALFYMQAHGIRRGDALAVLLPDLEDQGFAYLTIDPRMLGG